MTASRNSRTGQLHSINHGQLTVMSSCGFLESQVEGIHPIPIGIRFRTFSGSVRQTLRWVGAKSRRVQWYLGRYPEDPILKKSILRLVPNCSIILKMVNLEANKFNIMINIILVMILVNIGFEY